MVTATRIDVPMAIIPRLQMSTLGPYSFRVTISGAIQHGVPIIVVLFPPSEMWAQNPKSAVNGISKTAYFLNDQRTQFNVTVHAEQHVVAPDVTMNDPMSVQVLEALACFPRNCRDLTLTHIVSGDHVRQTTAFHVLHDNP